MKRSRIVAIIIIFLLVVLSLYVWRSCSTGSGTVIPMATPNAAQCQESLKTAGWPRLDYGNSAPQGDHWTAKGLIGCTTVSITYGNMTQHIVCLKAEVPVINGVVDAYVNFDYKSCPKFQEQNVWVE